ncbi:MAG: hypothetical protein IKG22_08745 [Atopobiaceae bacterium]|nr:hypothetical protein [Atopobiaceae bacterium]
MRCPHCGQTLSESSTTCTRCQADLSRATRRKDALISLAVAVVGMAVVALLVYIVLNWHQMQLMRA